MEWVLVICFSPNWLACRSVHEIEYPTERACYAALEHYIKQDAQAHCRRFNQQRAKKLEQSDKSEIQGDD